MHRYSIYLQKQLINGSPYLKKIYILQMKHWNEAYNDENK